jgi:MOSC domain-containing protein YiiM
MIGKILSLNIGTPRRLEWNGKSLMSSMPKNPVADPLIVHLDRIEGNSFANGNHHGTIESLLYIYGIPSALKFMAVLGHDEYLPGTTGETLTVDDFDESKVSVGDIFQIGDVLARATYPRIPCVKLNFLLQRDDAQNAMLECGYPGVYFQIIKGGQISLSDSVQCIEPAKHRLSIFDLYRKMIGLDEVTREDFELALANGAFPNKVMDKWKRIFA